jgi:ribosomal protein S3AE
MVAYLLSMCVVARRWTRQVAILIIVETRDKMKARMPNAMLILLSAEKDRAIRNIMLDLVSWADL